MRLDRFLANNTALSRKEVKQKLKAELVKLNGLLVRDASTKIVDTDEIEVEGNLIKAIGPGYLMLHKPEGVVCANSDSEHPTVFDLIDPELLASFKGLHVAGRLDLDTTGLVLITGDGHWSHQITSPNKQCVKTYWVVAEEFITDGMIQKLEAGVHLKSENIRTRPARVERVSSDEILLKISEGKYHQVKRMLHAVGNRVDQLHRVSIGGISLDSELAPGEYRPLTEAEINGI